MKNLFIYNIKSIYLICIYLFILSNFVKNSLCLCNTGFYGDDCTCDYDLKSALPNVNVTCTNLVWNYYGNLLIDSMNITVGQANFVVHGNLTILNTAVTIFTVLNSTSLNTTGLNITTLNITSNDTTVLHYGSINVTGNLDVNGIIVIQLTQFVNSRTYYSFFRGPNINISDAITPVVVDLYFPSSCEHSNVINRYQDGSLQLGVIQWNLCNSWNLAITVGITGFGAAMLLCAPLIVIVFWYHRSTFKPVGYSFHAPREYKQI